MEKYTEIPDDLLPGLCDLARFIIAIHTGTDALGERIPPGGLEKLRRDKEELQKRLAQQFGFKDALEFLQSTRRYGFHRDEVKALLAERE